MKVVAVQSQGPAVESEVETLLLSPGDMKFLSRLSRGMNPDMPVAFGGAHVIRTLLEHLEESDIDLSSASSEEEITRIAAAGLRRQQQIARNSRD